MEATAASIAFVQFAESTVKYIIKAYKLWEEVRELPAELDDLIADLKDYEPLFREVQAQLSSGHGQYAVNSSASALSSLERSKRVHKVLQELIRDMKAEMDRTRGLKRNIKAVGIILKKDFLKTMEKKLQRALRLLDTSLTLHQIILTQRQPDIISSRVSLELKSLLGSRQDSQQQVVVSSQTISARMQPQRPPSPFEPIEWPETSKTPERARGGVKIPERIEIVSETTMTTQNIFQRQKYRKTFSTPTFGRYSGWYASDTGAWEAHIQLPRWISGLAFSLQRSSTMAGGTFHLRMYNVVPDDSEIFRCIKLGDEAGVKELFRSKKASIFDKDDCGNSLLYVRPKPFSLPESQANNLECIACYCGQKACPLQAISQARTPRTS
jgi:hypothetical protein